MNRKTVKYSEVRKVLKLDTRKPKIDEGLAAVTHFLQSKENGAKKYYEQDANDYLEENNLVSEPAFQYELAIDYDIPFPSPKTPKFKFIDLFAGIGGFRMAFQNLGGKCVFTSDTQAYRQFDIFLENAA